MVARGGASRLLVLLGFSILAALFAYFNAGERVAVHFGVGVLYQVPFVGFAFVVYVLGMLTMYFLGLRHDLRVRRVLREYGLEDLLDEPEPPREPELEASDRHRSPEDDWEAHDRYP